MSTMTFEYRAVDRAGSRKRGVVQAATQAEAFRKVSAMRLTPVRLAQAASGAASESDRPSPMSALLRPRRVGHKDLAHFTYQLGVLMSSRIPLGMGLTSIAEQEKDGPLSRVITDVARRIESGENVAAALEAHQEVFGEVYIQSIRAAERSGNLAKVMEYLSDMLERMQEMRGQARAALAYPVCVLAVLTLAMVFLVGFVVPKFAKMFASRNIDLPVFTQVLMSIGQAVQHYWYVYLVGAVVAVLATRKWMGTDSGRRVFEAAAHRIPTVGQILRGMALARFSRVLGLSLTSGLGLVEAIELAGKASGRARLKADAAEMARHVKTGGSLADSLRGCAYLTPFTRRMLAAGEQSGEVPRMCGVVARHYERESSLLSKSLSTVIEPLLIVGIAGVVLVVALAIFMPMWDMVRLVG